MAFFDFSEMNKAPENLFGKKGYKWLNRIVGAIGAVGIVLCIVSYFTGHEEVFNIRNVGYIIFYILVGAIFIAALFRGAIGLFKFIRSHIPGIKEGLVVIIGSIITIIIGIVLLFLIVMISNWIFGDCSGHVDLDHVHFERY